MDVLLWKTPIKIDDLGIPWDTPISGNPDVCISHPVTNHLALGHYITHPCFIPPHTTGGMGDHDTVTPSYHRGTMTMGGGRGYPEPGTYIYIYIYIYIYMCVLELL